jgi:hypothetical protein
MRTVVTFQSTVFNVSQHRDYFINPDCFGDDLGGWLIERLRAQGLETAVAPGQEDFGWYVTFTVPDGEHCCVLGYRPASGDSEGTWIAWVERHRGLIGSVFRGRERGIASSALEAIHAALSGAADIRQVRWHRQDDFDRGDEAAGTLEPEEI